MQQVKRIPLAGKKDRHLRMSRDYVCDAILEFFGKFTTANPSGGGK